MQSRRRNNSLKGCDAACEEGMEGFDDYGEFATVCEIYGRGE